MQTLISSVISSYIGDWDLLFRDKNELGADIFLIPLTALRNGTLSDLESNWGDLLLVTIIPNDKGRDDGIIDNVHKHSNISWSDSLWHLMILSRDNDISFSSTFLFCDDNMADTPSWNDNSFSK